MRKKELTRGEELRRALCYNKKNGYDRMNPQEMEPLEAYCTGYKQFLDAGKTERECVERAVALAKDAGFRPMSGAWSSSRRQDLPGEPRESGDAGGDGSGESG